MLSLKDSLAVLKRTKALLEGHFILSSGLHSSKYVQCAKLLSFPKHAKNICLSLDKWKMAMDLCYNTKKPFLFVIRCDKGKSGDYMYMHQYGDDKDFNVKIGGRIDKKRDAQDIEPIIEIPFNKFIKIG